MSCPRLSDVREYWEGDHGAFIDTYVVSTTASDWQRVLETMQAHAWPSYYYEDSEPALMPSDVQEIFAHRERAVCLWQIRPSEEVRINCNFVDTDEIEFSVDPREIVAQRHLDLICEFISALGRALGKAVLVGLESRDPRAPAVMRYEPTLDDVVASSAPW